MYSPIHLYPGRDSLKTLQRMVQPSFHEGDFKAFYGDYEITVQANGKEKKHDLRLHKNGKRNFKIVI